jgi:hypothetical protein
MNEYDMVELNSDHPEFSPSLARGAIGIVVDLPANSSIAADEFTLEDEIKVFLLDVDELRLAVSNQLHDPEQH